MQKELTWSDSDSKRFEESGVSVTQMHGLASQLLKIKVQHYYQDFTLYYVHLVTSLQCYCLLQYLKTYFDIDLFCKFCWEFVCSCLLKCFF